MSLAVPNPDDWFQYLGGFPRPDWPAIDEWICANAIHSERDFAWQETTRHWLERLRGCLGGDYAVAESKNFQLLSDFEPKYLHRTLSFLETAFMQIHKVLGDVAAAEWHGKHVVLRFSQSDDYYSYVSYFDSDGEYAGSGGMFIPDGYYHIAFPQSWSLDEDRRTLVHELTHNLLAHLPLPAWLNEALAMAFEADIAGNRTETLSRELTARHRLYWNSLTIQDFWSGSAFSSVDGQELAYGLARILLNLIYTEVRPPEEEFRRFVRLANWKDAGALAAREHLTIELHDLVACFLGPGEWQPLPTS